MIEILFLFGLVEYDYMSNQTIYHFPVKKTEHFFNYEDKNQGFEGKNYDLFPWYRNILILDTHICRTADI
jgi:hypothetical protein